MPKQRVISYWQHPAPREFAKHIIDDSDLSDRDKEICWAFRNRSKCGDTQFYADMFFLTKKQFCERTDHIFRTVMPEVIRLAILGWKYENGKI